MLLKEIYIYICSQKYLFLQEFEKMHNMVNHIENDYIRFSKVSLCHSVTYVTETQL